MKLVLPALGLTVVFGLLAAGDLIAEDRGPPGGPAAAGHRSVVAAECEDRSSAGTDYLGPCLTMPAATLAVAPQSDIAARELGGGASVARRPSGLPPLYAGFITLQALDVYTTMAALKHGGTESNPTMTGVVSNPAAFVALKAGVTVVMMAAAERAWRSNHRGRAVVLMVASNVVMGVVVAHNASVLSAIK
jgi:hypothetical protein